MLHDYVAINTYVGNIVLLFKFKLLYRYVRTYSLSHTYVAVVRPVLTAFYVLTSSERLSTSEHVLFAYVTPYGYYKILTLRTPSTDFSPIEGDSDRPWPTDGQNSKSPRSQNFESCWKVWLSKSRKVRIIITFE